MKTISKKKALIITFLLILSMNIGYSQISDQFQLFLNENYIEGDKEFLERFYKEVKFPLSVRSSCRIGKLKTEISINKDGEISNVNFINHLGDGCEEEISRTLEYVKEGWTKIENDSIRKVIFIVAWQIGDTPKMNGDIKLSLKGPSCTPNGFLISKFYKLMKKEKYKKAKSVTLELLKRNPDSEKFKLFDEKVNEKLVEE